MKAKLSPFYLLSFVFCLLSFVFSTHALSQVPQGLNYQGVLRDEPTGNPITGQGVQIRFTIQTSGAVVKYQETHSTSTDEFGAISLVVGGGTPVGSYIFSAIDWSIPLYLKTEFEYPVSGTPDYDKLMGTTQLMAVPYSMTTDNIIQPLDQLTVKATHTSLDLPLFEVKNQAGNTLFGVYNEGVEIFVGDGAKGPKGGFAIGTVGTKSDYFMNMTPENYFIGEGSGSVITTGMFNSTLGYNAGRDLTEGGGNIFIGYLSGLKNTVGYSNLFVGLNAGMANIDGSNNVFLGTGAGSSNTGGSSGAFGSNNIFLGTNAGAGNTEGVANMFIGTAAGFNNEDGNLNIYIGDRSGYSTKGVRNTFIGVYTGLNATGGDDNIFIGNQSGQHSSTGSTNTFLGSISGWHNGEGNGNVYVGWQSANNLVDGNQNVMIGSGVANNSTAGNDNVFVGSWSGMNNDASGSVFIGKYAGANEENGNRLYIHNGGSDSDNALIYGEFGNYPGIQVLKLNAAVTINDLLHLTPRASAPVSPAEGDVYYNGTDHTLYVWNSSDWKACWE